MKHPLIKICGIQTVEMAQLAAHAGAHFIGILFTPRSKRCVDIRQAKRIADAASTHNAVPVAVFVDETAQEMQTICAETGIQTVQLHGTTAKQQHLHLPPHYPRIYVQSVQHNGKLVVEDNTLAFCDALSDFILFDHIDAGQGHPFAWDQVQYQGPFRFGVAGGLTAGNVAQAINILHPALIDVSSGVENAVGQKDAALIQQFISTVRTSRGVDNV